MEKRLPRTRRNMFVEVMLKLIENEVFRNLIVWF
jgi:hypothetical protein